MQRIDGPTVSATLPAPAATGTGASAPGFFGRGDVATATPATTLDVDWANMVQEELIALLSAAGIIPDKTNHAQVLAAIAQGNVGAGWFQIPLIGLIVNFGGGSHSDNTGAQVVNFAKPFVSRIVASIAGNNAGGPPVAFHGTGGGTKTQMTVYSATASNTAAQAGTAFFWIAIGF